MGSLAEEYVNAYAALYGIKRVVVRDGAMYKVQQEDRTDLYTTMSEQQLRESTARLRAMKK